MGIYTYLWNLKGMLRWAYGIFVEDMNLDVTYKPAKWAAGDMFFAYPGKNGDIEHSLREKNLLYGIQDFNILKQIDKKGCISENTNEKLGIDGTVKRDNSGVSMEKYTSYKEYLSNRNKMLCSYK